MGIRSDMQLTSEPTEKIPVGAVAAFETLGAVNRFPSVVRTKTTTVVASMRLQGRNKVELGPVQRMLHETPQRM